MSIVRTPKGQRLFWSRHVQSGPVTRDTSVSRRLLSVTSRTPSHVGARRSCQHSKKSWLATSKSPGSLLLPCLDVGSSGHELRCGRSYTAHAVALSAPFHLVKSYLIFLKEIKTCLKTNICVTSEMVHKTHIKLTISVPVKLPAKTSW